MDGFLDIFFGCALLIPLALLGYRNEVKQYNKNLRKR